MSKAPVRPFVRQIAANSEDAFSVTGAFLSVKDVSPDAPIAIAVDDGPLCPWDTGMSFQTEAGETFGQVRVANQSASPITITLLVGSGRVYDQRFSVFLNALAGKIALDGTDGTGIAAPTGAVGIRGWLSGIFSRLVRGVQTSANSISVALASDQPALSVTGPLTDAALRATPVPVSTGGLTDAQLRASSVPVTGPLTDTQLRATAVPVSAAALPLPSGAATDVTVQAVRDRLPVALGRQASNASVSVIDGIPVVSILNLSTDALGSNFTAFSSNLCYEMEIANDTGTGLEYKRGGTGLAMGIPSGAIKRIRGITNSSQVSVRRSDLVNTPVVVKAEIVT